MYVLGILVFLVLLVGVGLFSTVIGSYIDFPSIILILGFTMPILMASGLMSDFLRGFNLMFKKENSYSSIELKKMLIANRTAIVLILLSGVFGTMIGGIAILANLTDLNMFASSFAVALITTLYALVMVFVLIPIHAKIKAILITLE